MILDDLIMDSNYGYRTVHKRNSVFCVLVVKKGSILDALVKIPIKFMTFV